jgi:DNA-binding NtrC family response regulator
VSDPLGLDVAAVPPLVLVVDDEPSVRRAIAIAFQRAGFAAIDVGGSEDAEHLLRTRRVDALVLDLRMPDMRGDVLFHSAIALQPHLARSTVFVTGDVTEKAMELVAACGCPMLSKPFDLHAVLDAVTSLLARQRVA